MNRGQKLLILVVALVLLPVQLPLQASEPEVKDNSRLVEANLRFALKLFHVASAEKRRNRLSSPIALSSMFALLQNGADTAARHQIAAAFEFNDSSLEEVNQGFARLHKALTYSVPQNVRGRQPTDSGQLTLARSLWIKSGENFRESFLAANQNYYGAELRRYDAFDRTAAAKAMNRWIGEASGGLAVPAIRNLTNEDFVLISATHFKGRWVHQFAVEMTRPEDFTLSSGEKKRVPMMSQSEHFRYMENDQFQAIGLPYDRATLFIFLPRENSSLAEFQQTLTAENWKAWQKNLRSRAGEIRLPRFEIQTRTDLTPSLRRLGLTSVFDSLESLSPAVENRGGALLTSVFEKGELKVDERGTEITVVGVGAGIIGGISANPPPPFTMRVNRPFFFAIADNTTGVILFLGSIEDPTEKATE